MEGRKHAGMTLEEFISEWNNDSDLLLVHTSGSTGEPKPLWVEKRRMEASARITCGFLGLKSGDTALLCMPLDYIAGKMVVVRALVAGLRLVCVPPSGNPLRGLSCAPVFAAMVPLQVYNSLCDPGEKRMLMQIRHLIIGGGAIDAAMEVVLKDFPNAVWSTYGMTETLSHIALRKVSGADASCWYVPFAGVDICTNDDGCLVIKAPAVCRETLITNDIAEIASDGRRFRILGRRDNVVVSGGVKIQIEEVERLLYGRIGVPFMITKRSDKKFGEVLVMLVETGQQNADSFSGRKEEERSVDCSAVAAICQENLPKYWCPKEYITVEKLPLTETGKPARREAERMARC